MSIKDPKADEFELLKTHFPIGLNVDWQDVSQAPNNAVLNDWLLDLTSLTARLKANCTHFQVKLLGQKIEACQPHEANDSIAVNEQVLVREVVLYCDHKPQVFARSILPLRSLTGNQQSLSCLGEQALGQVLFSDPKLHREILQVTQLPATGRLTELAAIIGLKVEHSLWGRRSLFTIEDKPLMVAEVFLPGAQAYR
ncbi:chorismate--pyruvate lyase family protein [Thalassotalea aquiviva]|uniref:chorismate--pyruvate lyase family protein n=1 Tax=Thalassotalea aquiviva TaxID=3242415 RepID=UPI00352A7963